MLRRDGTASPQIFDRLTDPHLFTGAHKHRFDKNGQGRGLNGRDYVGKGSGTRSRANPGAVHDLSQITRSPLPTEKGKSVRKSSSGRGRGRGATPGSGGRSTPGRRKGSKKKEPPIFNKLTDSAQYTATHKHRFDPKTGKGKGLDGRDSVRKGSGHSSVASYDGGAVHDLSEITRPDFYAVTSSPGGGAEKSRPKQLPEGTPPTGASRPTSASVAETDDGIFAKLTDPRLFTGAHKARGKANSALASSPRTSPSPSGNGNGRR